MSTDDSMQSRCPVHPSPWFSSLKLARSFAAECDRRTRNIVGVHQPLQQARFPARSTACSGDQPVCACVVTGTRLYSAVSTTSAWLVARYPVPSSLSPPAASRSPRDELRGSYHLMRPARICSALDRGTTDTAPDRKHMHLDRLVQDRT